MKAASLNELKKELRHLDPEQLQEYCLRLAKFRNENKELLTYLLFEASNEQDYIQNVKSDIDAMFADLPSGNLYFVKKSLRKILRFVNRQTKYSGIASTALELRIFFCLKIRDAGIPITSGTVIGNMFRQQLKAIDTILAKLPEDLRADYDHDLQKLK